MHSEMDPHTHTHTHGPSVTKPNPENCKNCSHQCACHCTQLSYTLPYTTQHRAILIIFPLNLQTNITAQKLSIEGKKAFDTWKD